jgi:hypothetical protein
MSPREEAILADRAEEAAFVDMYDAAPAALKAQLGLRVEPIGSATALIAPRLPATMFNRVIGLGLDQLATADDLAALRRLYGDAGTGAWWLHWNPFAAPEGGAHWLAAQGFTAPARRTWAKMLRASADPPRVATDLGVAEAADAQVVEVAASIATSFGMPPFMGDWIAALQGRPGWRVYAVTDGERIVGGGCLFSGPDAGWLGMGAVLPSHRRRGGQGALMARRIADTGAAGRTWAVTETGEAIGDEPNPSLANMVRTGFRCVASRLNFECASG